MAKSIKLIQSLQRANDIVNCFEKNHELGVTEISNLVKLHKSTTFNIIVTLEHLGLLEQNKNTGKYKLGIELFRLGTMVDSSVRTIAKPYMEKLVKMYSESVNLVTRNDNHIILLEKLESPHSLRLGLMTGCKIPLYACGLGKAILLTLTDEELKNVIGSFNFHNFTENTITDKEKLLDNVKLFRENGCSFDNEEYEIGVVGVAAPIMNRHGRANYAMSVAGPKSRLDENSLNEIGKSLIEVTQEISRKIGF